MNIFRKIFYFVTRTDSSTFLRSKKEYYDSKLIKQELRKVAEVDHNLIPTYPRVTIYDISKEDKLLIFDSSDSFVINNDLRIFDLWNGQSIAIDRKINFKDVPYVVKEIQIDFLNSFDDYSQASPNGHFHSVIYKGRNVPYNIQIILKVI